MRLPTYLHRDHIPWHQAPVIATTLVVSMLCSFGVAIGDLDGVTEADCSKEQAVQPAECLTAPAPIVAPEPDPEPSPVITPEPSPEPVITPEPAPEPVITPEPEVTPEPEPEPTEPAPAELPIDNTGSPTDGNTEPSVDAAPAPPAVQPESPKPETEEQTASPSEPVAPSVTGSVSGPAPAVVAIKPKPKPAPSKNIIIEEEVHTGGVEHTAHVTSSPGGDAGSYSGDIKHRLPNVPPLTKDGYTELVEFADAGGDPYILLALHWHEDGFSDWSETKQKLEAEPETKLADLAANASSERKEELSRLYDLATAFGLDALRYGLGKEEIKQAIIDEALSNPALSIYEGGQNDIKLGRIDPRVLISLKYLQLRFNTVIVTSLRSGHGVYTASGNVSLHSMGQAVDIGSLDGEIIQRSTQGPGSNTEAAVKDLALLPTGLGIGEVISLWNMGAPSFALQDHDDHIHLGFK